MLIITKRTREYELKSIKSLKGVKVLAEKSGHFLLEVPNDRGVALVDFYMSDLRWYRRSSKANGESVRSLKAYFKLEYAQ